MYYARVIYERRVLMNGAYYIDARCGWMQRRALWQTSQVACTHACTRTLAVPPAWEFEQLIFRVFLQMRLGVSRIAGHGLFATLRIVLVRARSTSTSAAAACGCSRHDFVQNDVVAEYIGDVVSDVVSACVRFGGREAGL